jgi:hypothetical protein
VQWLSRSVLALMSCLLTACAATGDTQSRAPDVEQGEPVQLANPSEVAPQVIELSAAPSTGDELVCREEARVGTHLTRRRCFTRSQLDEATRSAQEWMRSGGRDGAATISR